MRAILPRPLRRVAWPAQYLEILFRESRPPQGYKLLPGPAPHRLYVVNGQVVKIVRAAADAGPAVGPEHDPAQLVAVRHLVVIAGGLCRPLVLDYKVSRDA